MKDLRCTKGSIEWYIPLEKVERISTSADGNGVRILLTDGRVNVAAYVEIA